MQHNVSLMKISMFEIGYSVYFDFTTKCGPTKRSQWHFLRKWLRCNVHSSRKLHNLLSYEISKATKNFDYMIMFFLALKMKIQAIKCLIVFCSLKMHLFKHVVANETTSNS